MLVNDFLATLGNAFGIGDVAGDDGEFALALQLGEWGRDVPDGSDYSIVARRGE